MGLLNLIFGCSSKKQTDARIDSGELANEKTQITKAPYELEELDSQIRDHISEKIEEAKSLIQKYSENESISQFENNDQTIDMVFEKWYNDNNELKESPTFVVEALGAAFGQYLVDNHNFEWQILTDEYGKDLSVVHKKYYLNSFPFSTSEKIYANQTFGSFQRVKQTLLEALDKADELQER